MIYDKTQQLSLLANILRDPKLYSEAVLILKPSDFDLPAYQLLWEVAIDYHRRTNELLNVKLLPDEVCLTLKNLYGGSDTQFYAAEIPFIVDAINTLVDIPLDYNYYKHQLPLFIKTVRVSKLSQQIASSAFSIEDQDHYLNQLNNLKDLGASTVNTLSFIGDDPELLESYATEKRIPTGSRLLDSRIDGGLGQGELGMITACPGVGKTTTLINFAVGALLNGVFPLFISLEVKAKLVKRRFLSMAAGIPANWLKKVYSQWPPHIKARFESVMKCPIMSKMAINDLSDSERTIRSIDNAIVNWQEQIRTVCGPDAPALLVLVDHLDEIETPKSFTNTRRNSRSDEQITATAKALSEVARNRDIAMWTATQGTKEATTKQILGMQHSSGAFHKNDPLTIGIGLGLKRGLEDDDNLIDPYSEYEEEEGEVIGEELVFNLNKNRNGKKNIYFYSYRGPTLKYWDRIEDCDLEQSYLQEFKDANPVDWHSNLYQIPLNQRNG